MPGARLSTPLTDGHAEGELIVRLGPIVSMFHGALEIERNDKEFKGRVRGVGRDSKSGSGARAIVSYAVKALSEDSSRVDVSVKFLLTGMLAQFGRSGLIKDVADHITSVFANNLKESLSGRAIAGGTSGSALNAFQLAWIAVRSQLRGLISKSMGKRN
jgi:carbon-monoxide dehydrogenase small subunit